MIGWLVGAVLFGIVGWAYSGSPMILFIAGGIALIGIASMLHQRRVDSN